MATARCPPSATRCHTRAQSGDGLERMRILFVTPLYLPYLGGLEVLTGQLLAELRDRGHEVAVSTAHGPGGEPGADVVDGIDVWRSAAHDVIERRDLPGILAVSATPGSVCATLRRM